jgi:hypothetical protein
MVLKLDGLFGTALDSVCWCVLVCVCVYLCMDASAFMRLYRARQVRSSSVSWGAGEGPAERALRALLLHTDPDVAYRHALGLYELPLAFMIINHAQVRDRCVSPAQPSHPCRRQL